MILAPEIDQLIILIEYFFSLLELWMKDGMGSARIVVVAIRDCEKFSLFLDQRIM